MLGPGQHKATLAALASGALSALAFPPFELRSLVFVAPLPLLWALSRSEATQTPGARAFVLGWIASFAHALLVLHWILWLPNEEITIPGLMAPALIFMAGYLSILPGIAAMTASAAARRLRVPLGASWAVLFTAGEILRSSGELAFPWGTPAYALAPYTSAIQFSSLAGFWGVSLWVALVPALCWQALVAPARRRSAWAGMAAALFAAVWAYGAVGLARAPAPQLDEGTGPRIAILQPNVAREIKWKPEFRSLVTHDMLQRTEAAARARPDLIVWPETAVPMILLQEPVYLAQVTSTARRLGTPILAGTLDMQVEGGTYVVHNSAAMIDTAGVVAARYDKQRLVPFSERMPFQEVAPWLGALNFGQSDFSPGTERVLFDVAGVPTACLICFESIFPELAAAFSKDGARLLINITNDFWFGDTAAAVQHAEMAIFRAVETRTPLLRCANTGVSMVVDRYGRVLARTDTFVDAMLLARLAPARGATAAARGAGDGLAATIVGIGCALGIVTLLTRK